MEVANEMTPPYFPLAGACGNSARDFMLKEAPQVLQFMTTQ